MAILKFKLLDTIVNINCTCSHPEIGTNLHPTKDGVFVIQCVCCKEYGMINNKIIDFPMEKCTDDLEIKIVKCK